MEAFYSLLALCAACFANFFLRRLKRAQAAKAPMLLYHKPTGRLLVMPRDYNPEAVDLLLEELQELPGHVTLDSPEFQRL